MAYSDDILLTLETHLGLQLPESYRQFLLQYDGFQTYVHPKISGKAWQLATATPAVGRIALSKVQNPNGVETVFARQLSVWADGIQDFTNLTYTRVTDTNERFPLDRLRACITIGEENADLLALDPSDQFSVWVYWHDGSDVQRLSESFADWLAQSEPQLNRPSNARTAPDMAHHAKRYVGEWQNQDDSFGLHILRLSEDGVAEERFDDGSGGTGTWRLIDESLIALTLATEGYKAEEKRFAVDEIDDRHMKLHNKKHGYTDVWLRP